MIILILHNIKQKSNYYHTDYNLTNFNSFTYQGHWLSKIVITNT